jgi:hypothetical protein
VKDLISFIPFSPLTSSQMGVPSSSVNQQAQEHPYVTAPLLFHDQSSKFEMKVFII